ncbi:hypothetical protein [Rahnella sp. ChDrAdgB13]|uniref:hypothetical protein n=1 Tax=Rahnella sp. ChDrAdgB13 TaxID=1850581 RepID=UPI001AD88D0B|nr:hypothetical protein [Rahnella sp. ChDrAdgB13]
MLIDEIIFIIFKSSVAEGTVYVLTGHFTPSLAVSIPAGVISGLVTLVISFIALIRRLEDVEKETLKNTDSEN